MAVGGTAEGTKGEEAHNGTGIAFSLKDRAAWRAALGTRRPVLAHLNADTTWLLQLPVPPPPPPPEPKQDEKRARDYYNILIDPWLQGPQSDVASWFSTQWHVVAPAVGTMRELEGVLAELEDGEDGEEEGGEKEESRIDCVVISHEFTDHCHQATLLELPRSVPVVATEKAAELVRSWNHFETVTTTPGFLPPPTNTTATGTTTTTTTTTKKGDWQDALVDTSGTMPPWLRIGRVITQGNALYYHSAVIIAFDLSGNSSTTTTTSSSSSSSSHESSSSPPPPPEAVIYSPHGIKGSDLACVPASGLRTLALLHGLDDVRIWLTAQLNLGARNGLRAVRASGARYWVATHDEAKRGGGLISWLLRRTTYSLRDAVEADQGREEEEEEEGGRQHHYDFVGLGSGEGMVLGRS